MAGVNPFRPNLPVTPEMFVGRAAEIEQLRHYLEQTKAGNPVNFLITGERGIGKSSLLHYIKAVAEGTIQSAEHKPFKFLVLDTDVDRHTMPIGLVAKVDLSLEHGLAQSEEAKALLGKLWGFLKQLEVMGVKFNAKDTREDLVEKAVESFA